MIDKFFLLAEEMGRNPFSSQCEKLYSDSLVGVLKIFLPLDKKKVEPEESGLITGVDSSSPILSMWKQELCTKKSQHSTMMKTLAHSFLLIIRNCLQLFNSFFR